MSNNPHDKDDAEQHVNPLATKGRGPWSEAQPSEEEVAAAAERNARVADLGRRANQLAERAHVEPRAIDPQSVNQNRGPGFGKGQE